MRSKEEYQKEREVLIEKGKKFLEEKPSAIDEMSKIMFRLNYIKGILFTLEVDKKVTNECK